MSENESQNQSRAFWDVCVDGMVKKKKHCIATVRTPHSGILRVYLGLK